MATLTNTQKLNKVIKEMKINDKDKAQDTVHMLDWMTEQTETLKMLYSDFKTDTKDKSTCFMEFCSFMWQQCRINYLKEKLQKAN